MNYTEENRRKTALQRGKEVGYDSSNSMERIFT